MANFPHALNTDSNMRLTNGIWDDNIAEWMIKVQNYVMSSGGIIWIPDSVDASGNKKVSVKDSALPNGAATQTTLADILSKILTLEDKIDAITDGTSPAVTQLSGSNMDLRGTAATKPLATAVTIGATYWSVDTDPHGNTIEVCTGTEWVVI